MNNPWCIIGGGIIGLLCARELRSAGESVVIIDRQTVGQESSWAGGGILSPLYPWRYPEPVSALAAWSQGQYPSLAANLLARTGIDPEWTPSGLLIFGVDDREKSVAWTSAQGVRLETPDHVAASLIEPLVSAGLGPALWMPTVAQIRNPRLLRALCADLRQSGVEFRENIDVQGFTTRQGRLTSIHTSHGEIETRRCLVAAGAWSGDLLATTGLVLPITPVKGQMLLLSAQTLQLKTMVLNDHRYIIPRRDGRVLVGSTLESSGYEKSTTEAARLDLLQAAVGMIPALAQCHIEHQWAGLRPGSPSGVPYIGQHPKVAGLFVCTGHFRNGIVLAPASARLVTDLMLGRTPLLDQRQFQLPQP
jgi:glycine oxidase